MANISISILRNGFSVSGQDTLRFCVDGIRNVAKVWDAVKSIFHRLAGLMSFPVDSKTQSLRDGIERAQIESLKSALYIGLTGADMGIRKRERVDTSRAALENDLKTHTNDQEQARQLAEGVYALREKIEDLSWEFKPGRVEAIREDLVKLTALPLYQLLKDQNCAAINFIQYAAIKLLAANGNDALEQHGVDCIGWKEGTTTPKELADSMHNYLQSWGFSKDGPFSRLIYFVCHWDKALLSHQSGVDPLKFDAGIGNPNFSAHDFNVGGKKVTFYYGPSITGSPIFEHAVLPAYRKFGGKELRFDHQTTTKEEDYARIQRAQEIADTNEDVLTYAVVGFDIKFPPADFNTSDEFFDNFIPFVLNGREENDGASDDNGYYIPDKVLSEGEIQGALQQAREICRLLPVNKKLMSSKKGKERVRKMMKLVADACLSRAILTKTFSQVNPMNPDLDPDLTALRVSGACKQDIDRGVVENIALYLFDRWAMSKKPLTGKEVQKIAGGVLGRAHLVEGRKIMRDRFEVLENFLRATDGKVAEIGRVLNDSAAPVMGPLQRQAIPKKKTGKPPKQNSSHPRSALAACRFALNVIMHVNPYTQLAPQNLSQ